MFGGQLKVVIDGDPQSVAKFFRAMGATPLSCTCGDVLNSDPGSTPPGYRAAMEFERGKEIFGNPNNFERK